MDRLQIVYINGDGIGPEVMGATRQVLDHMTGGKIDWIEAKAGLDCKAETDNELPEETLELIRTVGLAIKGPTNTPGGGGFKSVNVRLRQQLDLYAGVRPAISVGLPGTSPNVSLVLYRQNTEGLYACSEESVGPEGEREVRLVTRFTEEAMQRLALRAFNHAREAGIGRVTLVTKRNIHKVWGRVYTDAFETVAAQYDGIQADHLLVDAMAMQLVMRPQQFGVIVAENMFGDILSDLCAGVIGGLGVAPGANIGDDIALFESVHGSADDIAGQGKANPTALILSGAMLLEHVGHLELAQALRFGVIETLKRHRTRDLPGGTLGTTDYVSHLLTNL